MVCGGGLVTLCHIESLGLATWNNPALLPRVRFFISQLPYFRLCFGSRLKSITVYPQGPGNS